MTHAEGIMLAVAELLKQKGRSTFSRQDVREQIGVSPDDWQLSYTAIFQAMRSDHPGGAPPIGARFRGVFRRVERGKYTLTDKGKQLLEEFRR